MEEFLIPFPSHQNNRLISLLFCPTVGQFGPPILWPTLCGPDARRRKHQRVGRPRHRFRLMLAGRIQPWPIDFGVPLSQKMSSLSVIALGLVPAITYRMGHKALARESVVRIGRPLGRRAG